MKQEILKLRDEGKSLDEIARILKCSKSNVSYHCNPAVRAVTAIRRNRNRQLVTQELKMLYGGKCKRCGYNKCLDALHFHHLDPKTKEGHVGDLVHVRGKAVAFEEAKKCELICANCHAEIHSV